MVVNRRRPSNIRNRRGNKPRGRQLARTRNGFTQNGAATSHQDNVTQVRKFISFRTLEISNATFGNDYAFGLHSYNIQGSDEPYSSVIGAYASLYERYRIRKVVVRAQVGKGFTNNDRLKTYCVARVDVDNQLSSASVPNLQSLLNAENTITKTFTERGNVLLATYRPQCRTATSIAMPFLPNQMQWYNISDLVKNVWKGVTIACVIAEPNIQPGEKAITLTFEYDVEFRGRVTTPSLLNLTSMYNHVPIEDSVLEQSQKFVLPSDPLPEYDLTTSQDDMRTNFLTGVYHPGSGFETINVAQIGISVTSEEIVGARFRDNPTGKWYIVAHYANDEVSSFLDPPAAV